MTVPKGHFAGSSLRAHLSCIIAMAPDPLTVCASILKGLDPDLQEYVAGGLVEDGVLMNRPDALEFAAPLLEEHCDGDEEAAEVCSGIYDPSRYIGFDRVFLRLATVLLLTSTLQSLTFIPRANANNGLEKGAVASWLSLRVCFGHQARIIT